MFIGKKEDEDEFVCRSIKEIPLSEAGKKTFKGFTFDVETNGVDVHKNEVIELAILPFEFNENFKVTKICWDESLNQLREPSAPLDPVITEITGLKDSDLKGQLIDWEKANTLIQEFSDLAIAHKAKFDVSFLKQFVNLRDSYIGCSLEDIDWSCMPVKSKEQAVLCLMYGGFYEAHRSLIDCKALLWLMNQRHPSGKGTNLKHVCKAARSPSFLIYANGLPFKDKDVARDLGFLFIDKIWTFKSSDESEADEKLEAISKYCNPKKKKLKPKEKYFQLLNNIC